MIDNIYDCYCCIVIVVLIIIIIIIVIIIIVIIIISSSSTMTLIIAMIHDCYYCYSMVSSRSPPLSFLMYF